MKSLLVDIRDQKFVLNEMLNIAALTRYPKYSIHSGFDMVLKEAHRFAQNELVTIAESGDREGIQYDPITNTVKVPETYHRPFHHFKEGKWLTMCDDPEIGGDGFPMALGSAVSEIFYAGGFYLYGGVELTHAAAKVIEIFGTTKQKESYMKNLYNLRWMGSMCLTEPQAGTDVGAIATEAEIQPDGSYSIVGSKIFITVGEHNLTENIIHMVLARVKGDPLGTKGLSLFIVPKFLVEDDGGSGKRNGVYCTGIEHKMGLNGLCTCSLAFGGKELCVGYLLGERGRGIAEMFYMMNEQRLLVGIEGLSFSSCAYLNAVDYAENRIQGTAVNDPARSVAIIEHPDVKRMLLTMKAYVEGCRAMTYFASYCIDMAQIADESERIGWQEILDLLIPVVKAYNTDRSWEITGMAIQCAGGYGYCKDYPFERFARDCKITSIFEGANGIHAIDLVFRKIARDGGKAFRSLMALIRKTLDEGSAFAGIKHYAVIVNRVKEKLETAVDDLLSMIDQKQFEAVYARASLFLEIMGDMILGWMHLWQMRLVFEKMGKENMEADADQLGEVLKKEKDGSFYYGKLLSNQFYIDTLLKRTLGKCEELGSTADPIQKICSRFL